MCVYTTDDAYPTSLSYNTGYGSPAQIRNCNKMKFSLDKVPRQKTFTRLLLNRTVDWTRHVKNAYDHFSTFENPPLSLCTITSKPDVCYSVSAKLVIREVPEKALIQNSHLDFSAVPRCHNIFCLISAIATTRILNRSIDAVNTRMGNVYEYLLPNRQMFKCTLAPPITRLFPGSQGQLGYFHLDCSSHFLVSIVNIVY